MSNYNYCLRCFWYNALDKRCVKPKDEGYCKYTKSNV